MKRVFVWVAVLWLTPVCLTAQQRNDIVIGEIMADPNPVVSLPPNEWIELKNTSSVPINLLNWRIGDANGTSGPFPFFIIQPDSFLIVCPATALAGMSVFGASISVSNFPSLDNDSDQLFLKSATGKSIHALEYQPSWYRNELKKDGGWSLEMIDTRNPCSGAANWKASTSIQGGTPGKINSADAINADTTAPQIKNAYVLDPTTIVLVFDESLDSVSASVVGNYQAGPNLVFVEAKAIAPFFNRVHLKTNSPLDSNIIYTVIANTIDDCSNNNIGSFNSARLGVPRDPQPGHWIINEILFDPRPNGSDYIEMYNNSSAVFDASRLYIGNRNSSGIISSIKPLNSKPYYIFPGDHIVITENTSMLSLNYLVKNPANVFELADLPPWPDDKGTVVLLNFQGEVVDEVRYNKDWHFKLIEDTEGISLERLDPSAPSQQQSNWHSAASTAGFGTPTYKNSQLIQTSIPGAEISVSPRVFTPDNDGRDDIAILQYKVTDPGWIANATIFDATGKPVRSLVRNGTMGLTGYWNWDGLGDNGSRLPVGIYIILTEIFTLQGKKDTFKSAVVLARKL